MMVDDLKVLSTLTVRVERELLDRFRVVAIRRRKSMSVIVREFVVWYVEREEGKG